MHHSAYVNAEKFALKYVPNLKGKKILDVGSYDVNGTLKPIFEKGDYVGLDMESGPNVDIVSDAHNIPFENEYFDIVTSSSCFEHDDMFWVTFIEMCRVLKHGGYLYVQAPSNGPYHGWPGDNWRFYIDSWKALEKWGKKEGYDIQLVEHYIDEVTPPAQHEGNRIWNDSVAIYQKKPTQKFNTSLKSIERGHLNTTYRGVQMYKCPFDFVIYQMIVNELKPDLIIEIGTFKGGGALYFADLLDIIGKGEVHTINIFEDVTDNQVINHPRIKRFIDGYQNYDLNLATKFEKVLVIDDGSHHSNDVLDAFNKFKSVVTKGSYYIIEDGVLSDLGYDSGYGGGPLQVMDEILENNQEFTVDRKWCDFYGENATFNPNGYLKKKIVDEPNLEHLDYNEEKNISFEVSSYRLGDAYQSKLYDEDIEELLREHPNTIGAEYILSEKKQDTKCIDTITNIVQKKIEKYRELLPKDIEKSTVVHLRLGDVVAGDKWHEKLKRPFDVEFYKSVIPNQNTYLIGKPFFAKTSSTNYEEAVEKSEKYLQTLINDLNAKHFDGGHADIDLCCAVACECFVQGKGFFSDLIVEIRKKLNLKNIETTFKQGMKNKKVALVSTYCDTQEKIDVLSKNIDNIRTFGLDVIVISPIFLPQDVQNKCDYFLYIKDNPVLEWPLRAMYAWRDLVLNDGIIKITRTYADYGWAGLYQVKKLSEIALSLGYDYFYHMIYDLKFDETVVEGLLGEGECDIYSSKRGDNTWDVGLHFMVFNEENLKNFISHISLENYLNSRGGDAFVWLDRLRQNFPYNVVRKPVEDEIYYYEGQDFFNSSPDEGINFFIEKNDEVEGTIKLLLYDVSETKEFKIKINGKSYQYVLDKNSLIDLGFDKFNIPTVSFEYKGIEYDITEKIRKIKHNTIKFIS